MKNPPPAGRLTAQEIYTKLGPESSIKRIFVFDTIHSTNAYAKTILGSIDNQPTLVLAEEQTHGKGRFDRTWHSEKGKNLTFSLIVHPGVPPDRPGALSLCVAESIASAVEDVSTLPVETKWPNDLLIKGRKICGILLESVTIATPPAGQYLIVGVGLNVNQQDFPPSVDAASLCQFTGRPVDRSQLLLRIANKLEWLAEPPTDSNIDGMLEKWKRRCTTLGKNVVVQSGKDTLIGLAKNVAPDGALIVTTGTEDRRLYAGDVKLARVLV